MHGGREMREAMKPHRRRISRRPCARRPSPAAGWPLLVQSRSGAAFTDRLSMLALHRSPSADKIGQSKFIVFAGQDTSSHQGTRDALAAILFFVTLFAVIVLVDRLISAGP